MAASSIALRHRLAVTALALRGDEAVLEIGCGQGVATRLVLDALTIGHITALDRSAKMIGMLPRSEKLTPRAEALENAGFGTQRFDRIFAVNMDFNLRLGDRWPGMIKALLAPGGMVVLAFEAPTGSGKAEGFADKSTVLLEAEGFSIRRVSDGGVVVLSARQRV